MLARFAALDELGGGDQPVAEGDLFDDIGIVARSTEPLIDDVDEADVVGAIEPGVDQIRAGRCRRSRIARGGWRFGGVS